MSAREMSRAEVLGRVARGELRLWEAAELMRVSYRQAKRLRRRHREEGARGLAHRSRGGRSNRARPEAERLRVLELVREHYGGTEGERLGPTLAAEHLRAEHGVDIHRETLRRWMLADRLWSRQRRHRQHRRRRERKAHFGELVQMDGSFHRWLGDRAGVGCLMGMCDDATGTTLGRFEPEESIWAAADLLRRWVERHGAPQALYTDWKNVYVRRATPREQLRGEEPLTQFGRMCAKLGIEIIPASSPQAKGRIERGHGTHQDRLVKKMRLRGIGDYAAANVYLEREYWAGHNRRFARPAAEKADYHRRLGRGVKLDEIFSLEQERVLSQDWVVRHQSRLLQLAPGQRVRPGERITVQEQRSGKLRLLTGGRELRWEAIAAPLAGSKPQLPRQPPIRRRARPSPAWRRAMNLSVAWARLRAEQRRAPLSAAEMPGHGSGGSQTTAPTAPTALGNPAHNAGFPHSHRAGATGFSRKQKGDI